MTTKPTTLSEYIDELDRLVTQELIPVHTYYGTASSAFDLMKRVLLQEFRRNTLGVLRPIAREHKDEVNPIRQENARLRAELDKVSAERDDLARKVLEATGILRPQEEPEAVYFKTTNRLYPLYYREIDGALQVRCDNGSWIRSAHDSLEELFNSRELISVTRDEAEA